MPDEFTAGQIVDAEDLNLAVLKIQNRGNRTTTGTAFTTTETEYMRVDNITLVQGRVYLVLVTGLGLNAGGTTSGILARLRLSTSGAADITDTEIGAYRSGPSSADDPIVSFSTIYPHTGSTVTNASILLSSVKAGGADTGNTLGAASGGAHLVVCHIGLDPGDTGVDL